MLPENGSAASEAFVSVEENAGLPNSPTLSMAATQQGVIFGNQHVADRENDLVYRRQHP